MKDMYVYLCILFCHIIRVTVVILMAASNWWATASLAACRTV